MKKISLTLLFIISIIISAFSWGANGHRITGEIGQRHLNEEARTAISKYLGSFCFAQISTWPDEVRADKTWGFITTWHYISVDEDETLASVLNRDHKAGKIGDVVEAIDFFTAVLAGDKEKRTLFETMMSDNNATPLLGSTDATALSLLIHFIGDVHQPLHVGRSYDLGGNRISCLWFNERSNLHKVWDSELIEQKKLSFTEYSDFINHQITEQKVKSWQDHDLATWANESIDLRKQIYASAYKKMDYDSGLPSLSYDYIFMNTPIIDERLSKGGVRLAGILNKIYGQ